MTFFILAGSGAGGVAVMRFVGPGPVPLVSESSILIIIIIKARKFQNKPPIDSANLQDQAYSILSKQSQQTFS